MSELSTVATWTPQQTQTVQHNIGFPEKCVEDKSMPNRQLSDQSTEFDGKSEAELSLDDSDDESWSRQTSPSVTASEDSGNSDWLDAKMKKLLENSENALLLTNLPRALDSSDLIVRFYDAGYQPIRDFDFLHVPMLSSDTSRGYGVINLVDVPTRNAFFSSVQRAEIRDVQIMSPMVYPSPSKEPTFKCSDDGICSGLLNVDETHYETSFLMRLDLHMMKLLGGSENALLLYNVPCAFDSSDLILELYEAGFHPVRDFNFLHVPMNSSGLNHGFGVINLVDTRMRNAFISSVQSHKTATGIKIYTQLEQMQS